MTGTRSPFRARFLKHRDCAGLDFDLSPGDRKLVMQQANLAFTELAHNVALVSAPDTARPT